MEEYSPDTPAPWTEKEKPVTSVVVEDGVTSIKNYAFANCTELKSVVLPESLESIGENAFYNCKSISSVYYKGSNARWLTISIANGNECLTAAPIKYATVHENFGTCGEDIAWSLGNDGTLELCGDGDMPGISFLWYNDRDSIESVSIEEGVTSIAASAFANCKNLKEVTLPKGVVTIGNSAFANCASLTDVNLPSGVTLIDKGAFLNCSSLKTITIPKSVMLIEKLAFSGCESLTDIYYLGTQDDWNIIEIVNGNDLLTNANIHFE